MLLKPIGEVNDFDKKEVYGSLYKEGLNKGRNILDCESI
jgi:hypothetical protein